MALDAFKTNGGSPPQRISECVTIGCGARTHNHSPRPDFLIADHGTIFLLQPIGDRASAWVREHLPPRLTQLRLVAMTQAAKDQKLWADL